MYTGSVALNQSARPARIAIVGGGYAGLAAAVELASHDIPVSVYEASPTLGGRARRVHINGMDLDNGLHILIGAYRETLRLMEKVRAAGDAAGLIRIPLELNIHPQFHLRAPSWPAPWNVLAALLTASGLSIRDKLAVARLMGALKIRGYRLQSDITVAEMLARFRQTPNSVRYLWAPLCTAAMNTNPEIASAQTFANVLRDTFAAPASNSDILLPTLDFSELFPERAARYLSLHGGQCRTNFRVANVRAKDGQIVLDGPAQSHQREEFGFRSVILAVAPQHLGDLMLGESRMHDIRQNVDRFKYCPIYSVYLAYPDTTRLPKPMLGLDAQYTQWVFDRGQIAGQPGVLGAVISAEGSHQTLPHQELATQVDAELRARFPWLPTPLWHRVIAEKRATFACTTGLIRPETRTPVPGIFLAGDYVRSDYPATLESAVRSGIAAAQCAMEHV